MGLLLDSEVLNIIGGFILYEIVIFGTEFTKEMLNLKFEFFCIDVCEWRGK